MRWLYTPCNGALLDFYDLLQHPKYCVGSTGHLSSFPLQLLKLPIPVQLLMQQEAEESGRYCRFLVQSKGGLCKKPTGQFPYLLSSCCSPNTKRIPWYTTTLGKGGFRYNTSWRKIVKTCSVSMPVFIAVSIQTIELDSLRRWDEYASSFPLSSVASWNLDIVQPSGRTLILNHTDEAFSFFLSPLIHSPSAPAPSAKAPQQTGEETNWMI